MFNWLGHIMTTEQDEANDVTEVLGSLSHRKDLCSEASLFEIDDKGDWFYQSGKLPLKFCKLFATILHRIEGQYLLITPVERLRVAVASQALIVVDYQACDNGSYIVNSSIGSQHLVESFDEFIVHEDGVTITFERGVEAKFARACFYRFINEFII